MGIASERLLTLRQRALLPYAVQLAELQQMCCDEALMEYRVIFYEDESGNKPVVDFLEALRTPSPALHKLVTAGMLKLKNRANHGPPLTAAIHGSLGMMELRVGRTDIARVFFFFQPNREIVCTNGYVKKSQLLDPSELRRAERCKAEWERRHSH